MGESSSSSTTATATATSSSSISTTATATTSSATATGSNSAGGQCAGVSAWSSGTAYTGGQTVTYNGDLWSAKWWTQGDTPGGSGMSTGLCWVGIYADVILAWQRVSGRTKARARCATIPGREHWLNIPCYTTYKLCHWACARVYAVCIVDGTANDNTHCITIRTSSNWKPAENVRQEPPEALLIGTGTSRR